MVAARGCLQLLLVPPHDAAACAWLLQLPRGCPAVQCSQQWKPLRAARTEIFQQCVCNELCYIECVLRASRGHAWSCPAGREVNFTSVAHSPSTTIRISLSYCKHVCGHILEFNCRRPCPWAPGLPPQQRYPPPLCARRSPLLPPYTDDIAAALWARPSPPPRRRAVGGSVSQLGS